MKAVQLALEKNIFKAAKELGVAPSNLYRWHKEFQKFGEESFCGKGSSRDLEQKQFSLLKRTLNKNSKAQNFKLKFTGKPVSILQRENL